TDPFHSIRDAFAIPQAPLVAAQDASSGINPSGSCAVNSDPALSPCAPAPVLVNLTSTATIFPGAVQAAGSVKLTDRFSNFAPLPQRWNGDVVFLGAGASAKNLVALSLVPAHPWPILTAALPPAGAGVEPEPSKQFALPP